MTDTDKRCECCGTTKNVVNKGEKIPAWYCGPHNTCAENKEAMKLQRKPDSPRYKQKPYEIQIWFHAQFYELEGRYFLAEPHVVIKKSRAESAYEQYDSIIIHDPFYIQLVEYNEYGDGDILEEGGTWTGD